MKKQIIIPLLTLMILFFGYGYAQKVNNQSTTGFDRDMSLKEQLAVINAGKDNPAKAVPIEMDERMSEEMVISEDAYGPANDKAEPITEQEREPVNPPQVSVKVANVNSQPATGTNVQPEGNKSENVINYRKMNGENTQPQPEKSGEVINYRNIKGSKEQPEGKKPD